MIHRVLAITGAAIREALRSRVVILGAVALLIAVPAVTLLFGDDPDTRAWLTRSVTTEGLRAVLPVAAILGGAFLLKPSVKAGWTILPARRSEYFVGAALAGMFVLTLGAGLFLLGGFVGNQTMADELVVAEPATDIRKERVFEGKRQHALGKDDTLTWANPNYAEELTLQLPPHDEGDLLGTFEYQLVWTAEAPPTERVPVRLFLESDGRRSKLVAHVVSRYRVRFAGQSSGTGRLVVVPTDSVLIVGTSPERVRVEVNTANSLPSMLTLFGLCLGAALLCMLAVLFARSVSTPATAALAGMLLLATLTLLPSLEPTSQMAKDRRANLAGANKNDTMQKFDDAAASVPQLFPDQPFDEFLAGRIVPATTWGDAGLRLLVALVLLPAGAVLFRLRQIPN